MFTKQHYVLDVIAGMIVAYIAYLLFLRSHPAESVPDKERRLAPGRALLVVWIFGIVVVVFWIAYQT